jgi:hypothetical protein
MNPAEKSHADDEFHFLQQTFKLDPKTDPFIGLHVFCKFFFFFFFVIRIGILFDNI